MNCLTTQNKSTQTMDIRPEDHKDDLNDHVSQALQAMEKQSRNMDSLDDSEREHINETNDEEDKSSLQQAHEDETSLNQPETGDLEPRGDSHDTHDTHWTELNHETDEHPEQPVIVEDHRHFHTDSEDEMDDHKTFEVEEPTTPPATIASEPRLYVTKPIAQTNTLSSEPLLHDQSLHSPAPLATTRGDTKLKLSRAPTRPHAVSLYRDSETGTIDEIPQTEDDSPTNDAWNSPNVVTVPRPSSPPLENDSEDESDQWLAGLDLRRAPSTQSNAPVEQPKKIRGNWNVV